MLLALCAAIFAIAWLSVSTGVPKVQSPFPLLVIFPAFLGFPLPLIAFALSGAFALSQLPHFNSNPRQKPNLVFTIVLLLITGLTALAIVAGWSYGIRYQGLFYCVFVTIANVVFAIAAWGLWWFTRTPDRYRSQVLFGFALFAWMSWYALPYMGEI